MYILRKYGQKKYQIPARSVQSPIPPCLVSGSLDSQGLLWLHHSSFAACNSSSLSPLSLFCSSSPPYMYHLLKDTFFKIPFVWDLQNLGGLYHSPGFTFTPTASTNDFSGPYGFSGPSSCSDSSIATHCLAPVTFQTMEEGSMISSFLHLLCS